MPMNKRLIILALSALILAFLMNQVINLAQTGLQSGLQVAREVKAIIGTTTATVTSKQATSTPGVAAELTNSEEMTLETYDLAEKWKSGQEDLSLPLNIMFSMVVAVVVFLLIRGYKA